ncbi:carboxymuconolactone decarboxylase family protein [Nocardioides sp.]|uniref:carboxymuconolactone decarboxylase family protein n=1 Tax=Nocardioides sp. TaxID=35761 RepID=UPI0027351A78|nr:carboxymuconolactone decarboxylase family protein [Nocardioides sp.]MDP3889938.1 carboxymuconolactone decarboxylase family protein [Nocardioides sp.]
MEPVDAAAAGSAAGGEVGRAAGGPGAETPQERRARGLAKMQEVYGWDFADGPGDFFGYTADHLFGEIWSRPGLTDEQRRLLLIGLLAGSNKLDVADLQLGCAYRLGELDDAALREIVVFLAHYAGWPTAAVLNNAVETIINT